MWPSNLLLMTHQLTTLVILKEPRVFKAPVFNCTIVTVYFVTQTARNFHVMAGYFLKQFSCRPQAGVSCSEAPRCQALKTEVRHTCVPTILQIYLYIYTHKTLRSRSVTAVPMPSAGWGGKQSADNKYLDCYPDDRAYNYQNNKCYYYYTPTVFYQPPGCKQLYKVAFSMEVRRVFNQHCPKNNLDLRIKTEPVTAKVYVRLLYTCIMYIWPRKQT